MAAVCLYDDHCEQERLYVLIWLNMVYGYAGDLYRIF
jgi:hypothetical protein